MIIRSNLLDLNNLYITNMTGFSNYFNDEKTLLAILSQMASADGKLLGSEMLLMRMAAKQLKISTRDLDDIIKSPEKYLNNMPYTNEERFRFFYIMVQMMKLDLDIDKEETGLYHDLGRKLGYTQKQLANVLITLKEKEKEVVQPEEIKEIMKNIF